MDIFFKIFELYRNETFLMLQLNAVVIFLSIIAYSFYQDRKNPLSKQVLKRLEKKSKTNKKRKDEEIRDFLRDGFIGPLYEKLERNAQKKLDKSDLDFTSKEFMSLLTIGALIGFAAGFLIFPIPSFFKFFIFIGKNTVIEVFFARILAGLALGYLGTLTPNVIIKVRIKRREKLLKAQLIDFILSLADGIKTAQTPQEALRTVSNEIPEPMSSELMKTVKEIDFAVPYEEALQNLSDRINIDEFSLVFSSMQIQNRTGGHLEEMLRNTAKVAEERRETRAEVLKIVRETQNMTYVLAAAPFALFIGMFFFMGEEFTTYLFSVFGLIYFAVLGVLTFVAILVMKGISDGVKKIL